ncbi:MAG: GNAT family N-acetyltransferase [Acidimicrobiales bacterium]
MLLRLARVDDAEAIRDIYNYEVSHGTNTFDLVPRTLEEQRQWVVRHQGAHPAVVAVRDTDDSEERPVVVGFGVLSPYRDRPAYPTTVEDSVYVDRRHRGRRVGQAVLEELLRLAAAQGFHTVVARISGHNEASIRLHERCGFTVVGVEREVGRKHRQWLDVVELQRML